MRKSVTLVALAVIVAGVIAAPRPPRLPDAGVGDAELVDEVRRYATAHAGAYDRLAVAIIDAGDVRWALFGSDENTEYEIGSVTKAMTASLVVDAIERGELSPDTRLRDLVDLDDAGSADVLLADLATHHSGLPRLATSPAALATTVLASA